MDRLWAFVFKPRPMDIEIISSASTVVGTVSGMSYGWMEASRDEAGYLWRPVVYGGTGSAIGFAVGLHYKPILAGAVALDACRTYVKGA